MIDDDRTRITLRVDPADEPYWLVLGQSNNAGWKATIDGEDRGESSLVDGYANGWRVEPRADGKPVEVTLEWTPQKAVWLGLAISGVAMLVCVALGTRAAALASRAARRLRRVRRRDASSVRVALRHGGCCRAEPRPADQRNDRRGAHGLRPRSMVGGAAGRGRLRARRDAGRACGGCSRSAPPPRSRSRVATCSCSSSGSSTPSCSSGRPTSRAFHMVGWLAVVLLGADALLEILRRTDGQAATAPAGSPATETAPS